MSSYFQIHVHNCQLKVSTYPSRHPNRLHVKKRSKALYIYNKQTAHSKSLSSNGFSVLITKCQYLPKVTHQASKMMSKWSMTLCFGVTISSVVSIFSRTKTKYGAWAFAHSSRVQQPRQAQTGEKTHPSHVPVRNKEENTAAPPRLRVAVPCRPPWREGWVWMMDDGIYSQVDSG